MKAFEFLAEKELSDKELRDQIIATVKRSERPLLDKIFYLLDSQSFESRLESVLSTDTDAGKIKTSIARIFTTVPAPINEKKVFLDQFPTGMIKVPELLSKSSSIEKWFFGNNFSKQVFLETTAVTEQGIGPGELALASFSPELTHVGAKGEIGDLQYGNQNIEVKGKRVSWGRPHDARKMKYNISKITDEFSAAGVIRPGSLTVNVWISIRSNFEKTVVKRLSKIAIDNLFLFVDNAEKANLIKLLSIGNLEEVKSEWARLSFINYQNATGFTGILFYNIPTGQTRYVTDSSSTTLMGEAPQIYGPVDQAMPKIYPEDIK